MQFSLTLVALLASASSTLAIAVPASTGVLQTRNLHKMLYCVDETPAQNFQVGGTVVENNSATSSACNAYKGRNTGTRPQDSCPDCVLGDNGGKNSGWVAECKSAAGHLGGNEFTEYCKAAGASRGAS